jgi:hypothetical protein
VSRGGAPLIENQVFGHTDLNLSERWVMIGKLYDAVFGCKHSRYSFPVTIRRGTRRPQAAALTGTYVACLDCGKEFPYDWQEMRVITSPERHREHLAELAKHAA